MVEKDRNIRFEKIILMLSLFFVGTFHEYLSCVLTIGMLLWTLGRILKKGKLRIYSNITVWTIGCIVLFYGLSIFWAVDSGMAFIGFLKYLPVMSYLFLLLQEEKTDDIIAMLPYAGSAMTVVSVIGMQIPMFRSFFSVADRLAGFFQYPNTFALFLLVSELVVISKKRHTKIDVVFIFVLLSGILYTGSRTVFVLMVLSNIVLIFQMKNKRIRNLTIFGAVLASLGIALYLEAAGKTGVIGRFLTISLTESTFLGRILYFQDALPLILKHPLGLGYMGYYYMQQSVQTGVYSVTFVHNDYLQLFLDVGWIPGILFAVSVGKAVFDRKRPFHKRVILSTMALHCIFDFDLQFIAVFMIFLLFMEYDAGKEYQITKVRAVKVTCLFTGMICIYGGIVLALIRFGGYETAHKIYPFHTQNEIRILTQKENLQGAEKIADRILNQNEYVIIAYSVKARKAYSDGDFSQVITYKRKIFERAPFAYDEYEEYAYMLITGIQLYQQAGDSDSAKICREELQMVVDKVHHMREKLSYLGTRIRDQPETRLPEEIEEYVGKL